MAIICAEMTADGAWQFAVEDKQAFAAYVALSQAGTDEAGAWGGFVFDIYNSDDDLEDDGEYDDITGVNMSADDEDLSVITMAKIEAAERKFKADTSIDALSEDDRERCEGAFMYLREGG